MDKENTVSSKTRVSKQVRVTQDRYTIVLELVGNCLVIEHIPNNTGDPEVSSARMFRLKKPGVDALRELLGLQQPSQQPRQAEKPTIPLEEVAKRFTREGDDAPDRPPEEAPVEGSDLTQAPDKTVSGMD